MKSKDALLVLCKEDIPAVVNLQKEISNAEIWVFEPHLLDRLSWSGLNNAKFIDYDLALDDQRYFTDIEQQTLAIEQEVAKLLKNNFKEATDSHWQFQNIYFQLTTLSTYNILWEKILKQNIDMKLHVLIHDVPARFSAPSFWPALLLIQRLIKNGIDFKAYTYGSIDETMQLIPTGWQFNDKKNIKRPFVHLPTCFHDTKYFEDEIVQSHPNALFFKSMDFHPLIWSVAFPRLQNVELDTARDALKRLPNEFQSVITSLSAALADHFLNYFLKHTNIEIYASRQAKYLAEQYASQMIFYENLQTYHPDKLPEQIILSNHDAGLHGPFISFAKTHSIPVTLLPHSKVFNFPLMCTYPNVTALTHPIQGARISDIEGLEKNYRYLAFPEVLEVRSRTSSQIEKVGLVLNDISLSGLVTTNAAQYIHGINKINSWCIERGIQCAIRTRPGASNFIWLLDNILTSPEDLAKNSGCPISAFAKECDFCIMYDCPTSGAIEFLRQGVPIVNTICRPLWPNEGAISDPNTIPRERIKDTLTRLELYRSSPNEFLTFRGKQLTDYLEKYNQSLPLRGYL